MKKILLSVIFLLLIQSAIAQIPAINSYVTDNSGILSLSTKSQLENELRNTEKETNGVQFVIYIENEYPKEYSLEEYTIKIAEKNRIGKKGNDNGILLYIAVKDKKYRWETGYGVESTLNAALLGRVSREYLAPNFRNNDYESGIVQAVDVVKRLLLNSNDADIVALRNESDAGKTSVIFGIIPVIFVILVIWAATNAMKKMAKRTKTKRYGKSFYTGAAGGIFSGGFGRGGGSGGFGGFSGGGGGFGGGGHSGGW